MKLFWWNSLNFFSQLQEQIFPGSSYMLLPSPWGRRPPTIENAGAKQNLWYFFKFQVCFFGRNCFTSLSPSQSTKSFSKCFYRKWEMINISLISIALSNNCQNQKVPPKKTKVTKFYWIRLENVIKRNLNKILASTFFPDVILFVGLL